MSPEETNSKTRSAWHPILEAGLEERAWEAIDGIARALEPSDETPATGLPESGSPEPGSQVPETYVATKEASLAGGDAGVALFFTYLAQARSGKAAETAAEHASVYLDRAIDAIANTPMMPSLYSGFTGIGWTVDHLDGLLFEGGDDGPNALDEGLLRALDRPRWEAHYDLVLGPVGFAVYALEGLPRPSARRCLERLVEHLDTLAVEGSTAVEGSPGRTWFTPPEHLPDHQREHCPRGYYNLGVAHGVPAVLAVLARAVEAGVAVEKARPLLEAGVEWLLAQELPPGFGSCFSSWIGDVRPVSGSRLAWCYGDPGLSAALLLAARAVGVEPWADEALRIARCASHRPEAGSGIKDPGICHGAAGLGQVFNRLAQASGDEEIAEASRRWFERCLDMRQPGEALGDFRIWRPDASGELAWSDDRGFLTGVAGVGLALLGAVSPVEPLWDRILLASVPPRGAGA